MILGYNDTSIYNYTGSYNNRLVNTLTVTTVATTCINATKNFICIVSFVNCGNCGHTVLALCIESEVRKRYQV